MTSQFIVYADGGSRGNPGPAGYGAVVVDSTTGEVLKEIAESIGEATNNVAEYRGLIAGLNAAHQFDASARIEVRMDSKLVVEQMSGRWQIKHPDMRALAKEAREIHDLSLVTFNWIPRESNSHADRLANEALDAAEQGQAWQGSVNVDVAQPINKLSGRMTSTDKTTTLILVRHGETALTPERRFSGSGGSDPELSAHGRWQAANVARVLQHREVDVIISSPMKRARETAGFISEQCKVDVEVIDEFTELNFGEWEGQSFAEVKESDPERLNKWLSSHSLPTPGGESHDQLTARVLPAMKSVVEKYFGKTVVIVCHVTPIKQMVREVLGAPMESIHRFDLHPCGISVLNFWEDGFGVVRAVNDTAHLVKHDD